MPPLVYEFENAGSISGAITRVAVIVNLPGRVP